MLLHAQLILREVSTQVRFEGEQGVDWGGLQVRSSKASKLAVVLVKQVTWLRFEGEQGVDWGGLQVRSHLAASLLALLVRQYKY